MYTNYMDVYHNEGRIVRVYVPPAERGDVRRRLLRHAARNFAIAVGSTLKTSVIDPIDERQGSAEKRDTATNAFADSLTLVRLLRIGKGIVLGEDAAQLHGLYQQSREAELKKRSDKNSKIPDRRAAGVHNSVVRHDLNASSMVYPESVMGEVRGALEEASCITMQSYENCVIAQRALEAAIRIAGSVDTSLIRGEGAEALRHADAAGRLMENGFAEISTYQQAVK